MQDANSIPKMLVLHYKNENSFIEYILGYSKSAVKPFVLMNKRIVPKQIHTFGRKWRLLFRILGKHLLHCSIM